VLSFGTFFFLLTQTATFLAFCSGHPGVLVSVRGQLLLDQIDPHAAVVIDIGAVVTLVV